MIGIGEPSLPVGDVNFSLFSIEQRHRHFFEQSTGYSSPRYAADLPVWNEARDEAVNEMMNEQHSMIAALAIKAGIMKDPTQPSNEELVAMPVGDYVNDPSYKLMRLRILVTGTSGPTDEDWSAGLTRLLDHLEKFPLEPTK
jgi:hypothetical protein